MEHRPSSVAHRQSPTEITIYEGDAELHATETFEQLPHDIRTTPVLLTNTSNVARLILQANEYRFSTPHVVRLFVPPS